jgi:hypothetical protein
MLSATKFQQNDCLQNTCKSQNAVAHCFFLSSVVDHNCVHNFSTKCTIKKKLKIKSFFFNFFLKNFIYPKNFTYRRNIRIKCEFAAHGDQRCQIRNRIQIRSRMRSRSRIFLKSRIQIRSLIRNKSFWIYNPVFSGSKGQKISSLYWRQIRI